MYTNILIATDGWELPGKAVHHGIALAKQIGAKATALTVSQPFHIFTTDTQMLDDTPAQYKARMQEHAEKTLRAVGHAAQAAGVACEMVQVEHKHPYQAIIDTANSKACDLIVMVARPPRHLCDRARQRDGQGTHAFQDPSWQGTRGTRAFAGPDRCQDDWSPDTVRESTLLQISGRRTAGPPPNMFNFQWEQRSAERKTDSPAE
jgi:nucleotide-binding universal stress UspA family protein